MAYRRDNSAFRRAIAHRAEARKLAIYRQTLSTLQSVGFGLLVNLLKLWVVIGTWFARGYI